MLLDRFKVHTLSGHIHNCTGVSPGNDRFVSLQCPILGCFCNRSPKGRRVFVRSVIEIFLLPFPFDYATGWSTFPQILFSSSLLHDKRLIHFVARYSSNSMSFLIFHLHIRDNMKIAQNKMKGNRFILLRRVTRAGLRRRVAVVGESSGAGAMKRQGSH